MDVGMRWRGGGLRGIEDIVELETIDEYRINHEVAEDNVALTTPCIYYI